MLVYLTSYHFLPLSLHIIPFSKNVSICISCNVGDQVSHTNKTVKINQFMIC